MKHDARPGGMGFVSLILALGLSVPGLLGCASSNRRTIAQSESDRYLRLGYVQLERGQTQEALASAREAVSRDKNNADAHNFLGLIYLSQSEYQKAADALREAVHLNPYFTDAHNNLGVAYRELKDYDKALKEFGIALKDKNYRTPEKVHLNIGNLYMAQGVLSEAVRSFERAVSLKPDYILGRMALGDAYQKMGKKDLAAEQFRKVVSLAPQSPEATRAKQLLDASSARGGS